MPLPCPGACLSSPSISTSVTALERTEQAQRAHFPLGLDGRLVAGRVGEPLSAERAREQAGALHHGLNGDTGESTLPEALSLYMLDLDGTGLCPHPGS